MNYKGKKILVTGADGFIGSHLVELLVKSGAEVKALSYYNSFNYWGWLEYIEYGDKIEIVSGDIRDYDFLLKITRDIDIVFHLAALIAIPYSYHAPGSYIDTNVKGTMNICLAALHNNISKVIHTSTSEVYGTAQYIPIDEKHPMQPQSPYSASKIGADALAMSFYHSFNLPLTIARPFNTYGPRQSARAVIPTIITQILSGEKEIKLGDTTPTRDFSYVKDTCKGLLILGRGDNTIGETYNIGSNKEYSIKETFELIRRIIGRDVELVQQTQRIRPKKSEVYRLLANTEKITKLTGYKPDYTFEKGLRITIEWFSKKENLKKYKANIYNV
ncbi:MAG: SDR family NAD(P)-dependent oxidoreductase [Bacteroidetes bacterium]|nr:SDR family NAD(P)-dependent oxidoreductase [Bacteroidota bacterium]